MTYVKSSIDAIHDLPIFAAARATDPPTSKAAAAEAVDLAADHRARIADALELGPAGVSEIAERVGLDPHQVGKRMAELLREGRVERTGNAVRNPKGRREMEWRTRQVR